jgi:hypothetical protein
VKDYLYGKYNKSFELFLIELIPSKSCTELSIMRPGKDGTILHNPFLKEMNLSHGYEEIHKVCLDLA